MLVNDTPSVPPRQPKKRCTGQRANSGFDAPPIPPGRRPLVEILADPNLSNGAKLLARHLDGSCLSYGKWAAWPKVSTIADALGWDGDPRAFRKRFERAARELIASGDLARPRLGELVEWFDAEGERAGLAWPKGLRRNLCRSAAICVLGWKLAEAEGRLPSLTACDIPVASSQASPLLFAPPNVACHPPKMSHATPPEMSHPSYMNVRNLNVRSEPVNVRENDNVTSSGGGRDPSPPGPATALQAEPIQAPTAAIEPPIPVNLAPTAVAGPAPAPLAPRTAEELLAELAAMPVRFPFLAGPLLWALVDQGVPLPSPWDTVKLPPRPLPEAPADPPMAASSSPSTTGQSPPPVDRQYCAPPTQQPPPPSTIEDTIRRLPRHPELVKELATRLAEKWDDRGSLHGFIPRLQQAAKGEIPIKAILKAYRKASRCGPDAIPGAIFHHWLKEAIGGPPMT